MTTHTQTHQLNNELTLHDTAQTPLTINAITLTLTTQNDTLIESRLTFQVTPELYQHIHTAALFNLQPELRGSLTHGEFDNQTHIEIITSLKPEFLPHLDNAANYLQQLSQTEPNHPILFTENWLALEVSQPRLPIATGYTTFWNYLNFAAITGNNIDSEQISTAIFNFFQNWAETNLASMTNNAISQALSEVTQGLEEWVDMSISSLTADTLNQAITEMANALEKIAESTENQQNIFEEIVNFFIADEWPYSKIPDETALQTAFSGENGTYNCYALLRNQQQFVFYSVCPQIVGENQRLAMAEFITRANYGMIIGNFELDFDQGEIRYKTSIDVSEIHLNFDCLKNLVYTNVAMMDKYLPGIMSVINVELLPTSAINHVEIDPNIPEPVTENPSSLTVISYEVQPELVITNAQQQIKEADRQPHILTKLTPEEIGQFYQALQTMQPYQRKQIQAMTEKIKRLMIARLGDLGAEVFDQAVNFFITTKLAGKNLKLIQRYSGIAGRTGLLLQKLDIWIKQYGDNNNYAELTTAMADLETLFWSTDERLAELPTDKFEGEKELKLLIEIEKFREELAFYERFVKNLDENPDRGFNFN
jgi:hypothetical protein